MFKKAKQKQKQKTKTKNKKVQYFCYFDHVYCILKVSFNLVWLCCVVCCLWMRDESMSVNVNVNVHVLMRGGWGCMCMCGGCVVRVGFCVLLVLALILVWV